MLKLQKCLLIIIILGAITSLLSLKISGDTNSELIKADTIVVPVEPQQPEFLDGTPQECLIDGLIYHGIQHPEIVYAQAVLETGNFTSTGCKKKNNLFGLMKRNRLRTFDHWNESIICYKEKIQNRYNGQGDYYAFLERINYASDPTYVQKLKQIVKKNKKLWENKLREADTTLLNG